MKPVLISAALYYGNTKVDVHPNDTLPFPVEIDMSNVEESVRQVAAIMSNASGGHTIRNVKYAVNKEAGYVTITGNGMSVYYRDEDVAQQAKDALLALAPEERVEHTMSTMARQQVHYVGHVTTDQYGDGWKRPVWSK